ncbi:NUDIX hydrolase [Ornithinibacillus gellani]|uniref:NUDIX hydrolase n=1 Tax=Ornithinibacillus gellani TaxID=2293253 RepID=UPI000F49AC39|nr:NUDIX hydrolase [Ornithinibacillus gellani]TQS75048.1 NUDIX hydrolase [Ornithinibacillus gellani]
MDIKHPKHIIAVSAFVTNKQGEVLLVKTHWRSDTWESPGGQVEEGEALDDAVSREVLEETGIVIKPLGITGIYYNATSEILSVVFRAAYECGDLCTQPEEIKEAKFISITEENIGTYITRPNMQSRTLDAMRASSYIPYETWETKPYVLKGRLD